MCVQYDKVWNMVLVDTTIWIDLLRARDTIKVQRLRHLLKTDAAAITPVIVQELLQGASSASSLVTLSKHLQTMPMLIPANNLAIHQAAGILYAQCRWRGITPRSPHDCLIACIAIEFGVTLLHDDRDFLALATVEPKLILDAG